MSMVIDGPATSTPEIPIYQNQFPENGKKLYLNTKSADVHFLFGEMDDPMARVPAHKSLLSAESDVFETMFYGEIKEDGDIQMSDATDAEFMEFLQFFYLKEVKISAANIVGVLHLGHKYNVQKCVNHCVKHLMKTVGSENVCEHLHLGILYDQSELIKVCEIFIVLNTAEVLESSGFANCHKEALAHILKMNSLSCSEVNVFHACMNWVKAKNGDSANALSKESVEKYLGDLFYAIRFASMTMEQLFALQSQYEAVLTPDFITISKIIMLPGFRTNDFNTLPRLTEWNKDAVMKCSLTNGRAVEFEASRAVSLQFSASHPLLLGGFTCGLVYGIENGKLLNLEIVLSVDVRIYENCNENIKNLLQMKANLRSTVTHVALPHPIFVRPGCVYGISIGPFGDNHGMVLEELKTEIRIQSDIVIRLHKCDLKTLKPRALISVLDFNKI